jgi:hypothetical protein
VRKLSWNYFTIRIGKKFRGQVLKLKVEKSCKSIFKIFYFSGMTILGYIVYSGTNYHSQIMFGSGNHQLENSDWPYNVMPRYLKIYYMAELSYHVSDMVNLLVKPAQTDFFEMLLHHYIAIMLILGSYMANVWNIGINVALQMDSSEVFIGLVRGFHDIWPGTLFIVVFLALMVIWAYFRVFAFSYEVIWHGSMRGRFLLDSSKTLHTCIQVLLVSLLILNVYWLILFFKIALAYLTKGVAKDMQNPVEDHVKNKRKSLKQ